MPVMCDRKYGPYAVMADLIKKRSSVAARQTCASGHQSPHIVGCPLRLRVRCRDQSVFRCCLPAALGDSLDQSRIDQLPDRTPAGLVRYLGSRTDPSHADADQVLPIRVSPQDQVNSDLCTGEVFYGTVDETVDRSESNACISLCSPPAWPVVSPWTACRVWRSIKR